MVSSFIFQLTPIDCSTPGVVLFRVDSLQFQVSLNRTHMQSLHLNVRQCAATSTSSTTTTTTTTATTKTKLGTATTSPPTTSSTTTSSTASAVASNQQPSPPSPPSATPTPAAAWSPLDLQTLERFFEQRVVSPPYRPNTLFGFCRMLNVPALVLRDLLQIVRVEMQPDVAAAMMPGLRWHVQLLMRVPPSAPVIVPTGNAAVHMIRQKILFFVSGNEWGDC